MCRKAKGIGWMGIFVIKKEGSRRGGILECIILTNSQSSSGEVFPILRKIMFIKKVQTSQQLQKL